MLKNYSRITVILGLLFLSFISLCGQEKEKQLSDYDMGFTYFKMGDFGTALKYYTKAIKTLPDSQDVWIEYSACLRNLGRQQKALQTILKAKKLGKENENLLATLGNIFLETHCWDKSFDAFKKIWKYTKDTSFVIQNILNLGYEQYIYEQKELAEKTYDYAFRIDSTNARTVLDLGIFNASYGKQELGKAQIEAALTALDKTNDKIGVDYAKESLKLINQFNGINIPKIKNKPFQNLPKHILESIEKDKSEFKIDSKIDLKLPLFISGALSIQVPEEWNYIIESPKANVFTLKFFTVDSMEVFNFNFTPLETPLSLDDMKSAMQNMIEELKKTITETSPELIQIKKDNIKGYYCSVTDKSLNPKVLKNKDFPFVSQGIVNIEDISIFFAVYSRSNENNKYFEKFLDVIKSMEFLKY